MGLAPLTSRRQVRKNKARQTVVHHIEASWLRHPTFQRIFGRAEEAKRSQVNATIYGNLSVRPVLGERHRTVRHAGVSIKQIVSLTLRYRTRLSRQHYQFDV